MTRALYLDDGDAHSFEARVERVVDDRVVLDRTCFYPTGGGQPYDTGTLTSGDRTWTVRAVRKRDTIYHVVDGDPPATGAAVTGEIDWERRYAHMRYHTAQHLLSAYLLAEYDAETTGNQLYHDHAHLDCSYDRFDETDLAAIERGLNELVDSALPVRWYALDRDDAEASLDTSRTRIHLLPDSITEVRIVEIGPEDAPYDRTACAGTHVSNTDEIGTVRVTGRQTQGRHEERIEFVLE